MILNELYIDDIKRANRDREKRWKRKDNVFTKNSQYSHNDLSFLARKKPQIDSTTIAKHVHITTTKKNLSKEKSPVSRDLFFSLRTNDCITTIVTSFSSEYIVHRIEADARSTKIDF